MCLVLQVVTMNVNYLLVVLSCTWRLCQDAFECQKTSLIPFLFANNYIPLFLLSINFIHMVQNQKALKIISLKVSLSFVIPSHSVHFPKQHLSLISRVLSQRNFMHILIQIYVLLLNKATQLVTFSLKKKKNSITYQTTLFDSI